MENFVGRDVGRYHIVEQLGEGGMAVVYKAFDTSLERFVAIKFIRKETIGEQYYPQMIKRFEREAKVLASLDHPNIVDVFEYGQYQGSPYLVMKFIPCGALHPGKMAMPYQQAAKLLAPVARALEYAHQHGVIHRDIKPSNILICDSGDPTISDFGIAKILDMTGDQGGGGSSLTSTGMPIGTPEYMAPEQWLGKPVLQSDIYGLGMVLYELVTGRLPYIADTPAAVMVKQATEPLPRPRQFLPSLPDAVETVVFKALATRVENRYTSMGEFAAALEGLASGDSTAVAPSVEKPTLGRALPEAVTRRGKTEQSRSERETAKRLAQQMKQRQANEEKVRRMAAEDTRRQQQVAGVLPVQAGSSRRVRAIWMAGGGAGLLVLFLLGGWLVAGSSSPLRKHTPTPTLTFTPTFTPSPSPSVTQTITLTASPSPSKTPLPTATSSPSLEPATITPTVESTATRIYIPPTLTETDTPVPPRRTKTPTSAPPPTATPTPLPPTKTPTPPPGPTWTPSITPVGT